jgi:ribosome-associated heat shock protein Hsp15
MSETSIRLDKWLFFARFFKSREKATAAIIAGLIKLNGEKVEKSSQSVKPGDVLIISQGKRLKIIRVQEMGTRRGPVLEAQGLYEDLEATIKLSNS